jgi:nicotinamidase-related amidase
LPVPVATWWSGCCTPSLAANLQQSLTEAGIRELVVCGIRTEQCVETTARIGSDLGYRVVFVTDATTTKSWCRAGGRPRCAAGRG